MISLRKFVGVLSLTSALVIAQASDCNAMDRNKIKEKSVDQEASSSTERATRDSVFTENILAIVAVKESLLALAQAIQEGDLNLSEKKAGVEAIISSMSSLILPCSSESSTVASCKQIIQSLLTNLTDLVRLVKNSGDDLELQLIIGLIPVMNIQLFQGQSSIEMREIGALMGKMMAINAGLIKEATVASSTAEVAVVEDAIVEEDVAGDENHATTSRATKAAATPRAKKASVKRTAAGTQKK